VTIFCVPAIFFKSACLNFSTKQNFSVFSLPFKYNSARPDIGKSGQICSIVPSSLSATVELAVVLVLQIDGDGDGEGRNEVDDDELWTRVEGDIAGRRRLLLLLLLTWLE
jgi:hypothetical protein